MSIEVSTKSGRLRGLTQRDHVAFLGVPFARAPLAELRFAAPEPVASWTGVRDALEYGPCAPQNVRETVPVSGPQSEDCLSLNVFTPSADSQRRPVMVWIHGGGFIVGAASQPIYDGGALAARGDVVVVTVNYRLGALGYLYVAGPQPSQPAASNAGQHDQIAALRWVRDNIAAFGGDPEQVTIFGESAGSVAVCALLTMPEANGLFVRAIAQSGTANRSLDTDTATGTTHALAKKLGVAPELSALRAVPIQALLDAQDSLSSAPGLFSPVVDHASIPERPLQAVRSGSARTIPLLIGTNRDETKLYNDPKREQLADDALEQHVRGILPRRASERAASVIATYRESRQAHGLPATNNDILDALGTAARFWIPSTRLAEAQAAQQPDTYMYLFDWESPARHGAFGSCHALELPFVFGTLATSGMSALTGTGPEAEQLSERMMDAWLAFAKTGNPSTAALGAWPRYDGEARKTMILGKRCRVDAAPFEQERTAWNSFL